MDNMENVDNLGQNAKRQEDVEEQPLKKENISDELRNFTFMEKLKYIKSNVTVEPVLTFFIMPSMLTMLATQNLNLEKACRVNLAYGQQVCNSLTLRKRANLTFEEDEVQKLIASVQVWKGVVTTALPTVLMLFIGGWSDKKGRRKICMLLPIFAEFMTCILNIVNTYFFHQVSVEWTVFMEVLFPAITGGWYAMFLGTFSYLGDITTKETRTFRLGILNLCMTIGFPLGMGFSGILLKQIGFYGVFSTAAVLFVLNFLYVYFFIEDHTWLNTEEKKEKGTDCSNFVKDFFNLESLKETLNILVKKGPNNKRLRICLLIFSVCLFFGPMWGEMSLMYIFLRYRFNWNEITYSAYATYNLIAHSIGTLFSISILSKKLKVDDAVLGIVSTTSKICGSFVLAFAATDRQVYATPIVEILSGSTSIALRSLASKLVSHQELGKVFSLFGVAETMMPIIFTPVYNKVYILTLKVMPGAIFLISVAVTLPGLVIFCWFYNTHKKDIKAKRIEIPPHESLNLKTKSPLNKL